MTDLRKHARGKRCSVRLPEICNRNTETTVLAHVKNSWCGSIKPPDICAVHACSACHDVIDGRNTHSGHTQDEIQLAVFRALCEMLYYYAKEKIVVW